MKGLLVQTALALLLAIGCSDDLDPEKPCRLGYYHECEPGSGCCSRYDFKDFKFTCKDCDGIKNAARCVGNKPHIAAKATGPLPFSIDYTWGSCLLKPYANATFNKDYDSFEGYASSDGSKAIYFLVRNTSKYVSGAATELFTVTSNPQLRVNILGTGGIWTSIHIANRSMPPSNGSVTFAWTGMELGDSFSIRASGYLNSIDPDKWEAFSLDMSGYLSTPISSPDP